MPDLVNPGSRLRRSMAKIEAVVGLSQWMWHKQKEVGVKSDVFMVGACNPA